MRRFLMGLAKLFRRTPACFSGGGRWSLLLRRRRSGGEEEGEEEEDELLPEEWRRAARGRLIRLAGGNSSAEFKSLARSVIWSSGSSPWSTGKKRGAVALKSLTGVCNLLEITAQQRKAVRLAISPQVTEHRIWRGAVEGVLREVAAACSRRGPRRSPGAAMAEQIAACCLQFLAAGEQETPLWMQLAPERKTEPGERRRDWAEVLEMVNHLCACLAKEKDKEQEKEKEEEEALCAALEKAEAMKEGLRHIKDLLLEREEIGYKEARRQDCLVQKRLCKSLGHTSRCLFLLLLHYLYGSIGGDDNLAVDFCVIRPGARDRREMHAGVILSAGDAAAVSHAVRQLDRVFGLLELVWKTAEAKSALELHGHIWCLGGAAEKSESIVLHSRGRQFFIHHLIKP
ncbi:exosome complex exonuclease [Wolffia australiana]